MPMKNPPHPGLTIRHDCIEALGLSVAQAARALGVTRQALNNILSGNSAISPEMSVLLEKIFGSTAQAWLRLQTAYDLSRIEASVLVTSYQHHPRPPALSSCVFTITAQPPSSLLPGKYISLTTAEPEGCCSWPAASEAPR